MITGGAEYPIPACPFLHTRHSSDNAVHQEDTIDTKLPNGSSAMLSNEFAIYLDEELFFITA